MKRIIDSRLSEESLELLASRFRALGEISRLKIVSALQGGEKSVSELVESTGLSQPNLSRHLQILQFAGVLSRRKVGVMVKYQIADRKLLQICAAVCKD